jgi:oligopeptide/dipeptide ABC transporter ATP-binding protein
VSVQAQLLNLLDDLRAVRSMAMIFISHDMTVVEYFCDKIAIMYMGKVMELVSSAELSHNAVHPYTLSLKASAPRFDVFKNFVEEKKAPIRGEVNNRRKQINGCPFAPRCMRAMPECVESLPELIEASPEHLVRCHYF